MAAVEAVELPTSAASSTDAPIAAIASPPFMCPIQAWQATMARRVTSPAVRISAIRMNSGMATRMKDEVLS